MLNIQEPAPAQVQQLVHRLQTDARTSSHFISAGGKGSKASAQQRRRECARNVAKPAICADNLKYAKDVTSCSCSCDTTTRANDVDERLLPWRATLCYTPYHKARTLYPEEVHRSASCCVHVPHVQRGMHERRRSDPVPHVKVLWRIILGSGQGCLFGGSDLPHRAARPAGLGCWGLCMAMLSFLGATLVELESRATARARTAALAACSVGYLSESQVDGMQ